MSRWAVVVVVAACGGGSGSSAGSKSAAATPPPKPACVTPPEEVANIAHASTIGTRVQYCVGKAAECFALDTGSGAFERLPEVPKPANGGVARIETTNPRLEVCLATSCKALTPNVLPSSTILRAATNAAGTHAVILLGDAAKGKGYAEVWDVELAKRTATFRYARGDFQCGGEVALLDDKTIYVSASQCGQPAARGGLYKLDGRKIANVGGKDFGTFGGAFVQVTGTVWAFLEENANQLVIQDIASGKVKKTINTASLFKNGGAEMGNPGESALVRLADGKLAVIAGAPATGSVATIDVETGELKVLPAPVCKSL